MLNLEVTPPTVIATHPMPDCQPLAMRYYQDPWGSKYLFIAGGALGVYRLTLCSNLFQPPLGSCSGGYSDLRVEGPLPTGSLERKRCVDVDVLETTSGPVLFALFAASSNPSQSSVGPTELHAYTWNQSGTTTHIAGTVFPWGTLTSPVEVGTSLAVDPNDGDSIYVGLGKGGIRRVDLTGMPANPALVQHLPYTWECPPGTNYPQHVRDIAIVSVPTTPSQSVLYAALNYNELLEITDLGGGTQAYSRTVLESAGPPARPPGYAEHVAAIVSGMSVFVAITAQKSAGKWDDAIAPYTVNGFWSDICLSIGAPDPDDPNLGLGVHAQVQCFRHDFPSGQLTFKSLIDYTALNHTGAPGTESAIFRPGPGSLPHRLFLCSRTAGTEIYDFDPATGASSAVGGPFIGETFGGQEGTISLRNPGVVEFVAETTGATLPTKSLAYIDPQQPFGITLVPKTDHSPCDNPAPAPPAGSPICALMAADPGLYSSSLFEEAHWLDVNPANPWGEYFVAGRRVMEPFGVTGSPPDCLGLPDCASPLSFCDANGDPRWWMRKRNYQTNPLGDAIYRTGWRVINLAIPPSGMPSSGPSLAPRWWEIDLPEDTGTTATDPAEYAAPGDDRLATITDTRMTNGLPNVVYLTRSGTSHGVKVLKTSDIVSKAELSCPSSPPGISRGIGEYLPFGLSDYRSVLTHVELQIDPGGNGCATWVHCEPSWYSNAHQLADNRSVLYTTPDSSGGTMYVLAIASGFPASFSDSQHVQLPECLWTSYAGQAMLVLVDVTKTGQSTGTGAFRKPKVLRVALGTLPNSAPQGHAIAVCTMSAGSSTYAFVGDIMGMIWVFDVTGSNLLPAPTGAYLPGNRILKPVAWLALPKDPYDGRAANCIDLLVVNNILYCALSRQGIGIVDVTNPIAPALLDVMDTPGLTLGLAHRIVSTPQGPRNQLIVGDSRCGIRVYQD